MRGPKEVEIKFLVPSIKALQDQLVLLGFACVTPSTREHNTLYDLPGQLLRRKGQLLRLRKYGSTWALAHKARAATGRHKSRVELETHVEDGLTIDAIFRALGYRQVFVYEKFRSEWTDGNGHVVLDRTPIGNIAEIEGTPAWIDQAARALGVTADQYITNSYAELFFEWKRKYKQKAVNMTFRECGGSAKAVLNARKSSAEAAPGSGVRPRRA
jgi:adenylate cyclase class 2